MTKVIANALFSCMAMGGLFLVGWGYVLTPKVNQVKSHAIAWGWSEVPQDLTSTLN